ncbi:MAG: hypothetical protein DHS20C14_03670 [Phycisphaeraceae bacterium]|nr:MAG: hypothetical protein DHS20C14_03670 [Phycisphaeraceae bacterium]
MVLFGGTFDPVHLGHAALGVAARDAADPDASAWLIFVPAAQSPHKDEAPGASGPERAKMLTLATAGLERAGVWTAEIDRAVDEDGPSYWVDTLIAARGQLGRDADLRFVLGSDQVLALPRWHRWREILGIASPVVLAREPHARVPDLIGAMRADPAWDGEDLDAWAGRVVDAPRLPHSATEIRRALACGDQDIPGLAPEVLAFIRERGLYAR